MIVGEQALVLASRNTYPTVAPTRGGQGALGLAAGGGIALLLGGLAFWTMSEHREARSPVTLAPERSTPLVLSASQMPPIAAVPLSRGLLMPSVPSVASPPRPASRTSPAPIIVFDSNAPTVTLAPPIPTSVGRSGGGTVSEGGADGDQFARRVSDGDVQVATAQLLSNPAATVTQGTLIPAVLETAIDTDLPGYARAVVSRDVASFDGRHVLIPRSSRLIGQYKSGLAAGQTRAYVIWTRLIRPDGVSVALSSPAVDFTGTTGLTGRIDGHFMKRFGSAVLLSVVGGLGALGSSGTSVVLSGGGQSAASVAAQRDTAIPPTIRIAQGQPIRVFTAKDLDFSTVPSVLASQ